MFIQRYNDISSFKLNIVFWKYRSFWSGCSRLILFWLQTRFTIGHLHNNQIYVSSFRVLSFSGQSVALFSVLLLELRLLLPASAPLSLENIILIIYRALPCVLKIVYSKHVLQSCIVFRWRPKPEVF